MQILYLWDTQGQSDVEMARQVAQDHSDDPLARQYGIDMATGTWEQREAADRWVERLAPQWPTHRQAVVDRNLLRLAIWELTSTKLPPRVAIDEAIELAKHFSTQQSASFINGVLDAILKEHQTLTSPETPAEGQGPQPGALP